MFFQNQQAVVSVLLPVHNGERYLRSSIESILRQTYKQIQLLVIDDGSTDRSRTIVNDFAAEDGRITLCPNGSNLGLIGSLNKGLGLATGEFVARQDADDISCPSRVERQIQFLQAHPEVGIIGSAMDCIDEKNRPLGHFRHPESDAAIRFGMLFDNVFIHTSVMFRRELLKRHELSYDPAFKHAEDYDLWTRILEITKGHNLEEALVQYRIHSDNVSHKNMTQQMRCADAISARQLQKLGRKPDLDSRTRRVMLHLFTNFLFDPSDKFSGDEKAVLPQLRNIAESAIEQFSSADVTLLAFVRWLERAMSMASP